MIKRNTTHENLAATGRLSNVRDVCRILFRHRRKMLVVFCSTMALFVVALIVLPRTYTSEARLLLRLGRESVSLDPTATLGQTVSVDGTREEEINSELEILRSRVLLEDVVDRVGADMILKKSPDNGDSNSNWADT